MTSNYFQFRSLSLIKTINVIEKNSKGKLKRTLDRTFTNYIIIWPHKKHYVWDWNLPANRVKAWDFLRHFLLRSYRSSYPHWVHWFAIIPLIRWWIMFAASASKFICQRYFHKKLGGETRNGQRSGLEQTCLHQTVKLTLIAISFKGNGPRGPPGRPGKSGAQVCTMKSPCIPLLSKVVHENCFYTLFRLIVKSDHFYWNYIM